MLDPEDISAAEFPDIAPYRESNSGIEYLHRFDSGTPGPHAMVTAIVHGNEVCGVHALCWLLEEAVRPERGVLSLCFVNVAAYQRFDPDSPRANRYADEDFNRLWDVETLDGRRDSIELRRARELRPYLDTVDHLLDVHSMSASPVPLSMAGPLDKGRRLAAAIGIPEWIIMDEGHVAGQRMRDYAAFRDPSSERSACLIECGMHFWEHAPAIAKHAAARFLAATEILDSPPTPTDALPPAPDRPRTVEVTGPYTIRTDHFSFTDQFVGLEVIPAAGTRIGMDGDTPVTTPYDDCVLIMPSTWKRKGESALRFGRITD